MTEPTPRDLIEQERLKMNREAQEGFGPAASQMPRVSSAPAERVIARLQQEKREARVQALRETRSVFVDQYNGSGLHFLSLLDRMIEEAQK